MFHTVLCIFFTIFFPLMYIYIFFFCAKKLGFLTLVCKGVQWMSVVHITVQPCASCPCNAKLHTALYYTG